MSAITEAECGIKNMPAFLDMLAVSEGTSTSKATRNDGYDVIVTGIDGNPEVFTDYSIHPFARGRKSKVINSKGLTSNASGRYQFMLRDYLHYRALLRLPDFGSISQDRWAIQLIRERGALADIRAGHFSLAVAKVSNLWASLPGAGYGQHENELAKLERAYRAAGGTVV
jgi:muramidase (phage lysozyme)